MAGAMVKMNILKNKLPNLHRMLPEEADWAAEDVAREILKFIDEEVPVDSGDLRDTGDVGRAPGGYAITYGGGDVDYAVPVHNGHDTASGSHVPANPFMVRGYQKAGGAAQVGLRRLKNKVSDQ